MFKPISLTAMLAIVVALAVTRGALAAVINGTSGNDVLDGTAGVHGVQPPHEARRRALSFEADAAVRREWNAAVAKDEEQH